MLKRKGLKSTGDDQIQTLVSGRERGKREREMEKCILELERGTTCSSWNYAGRRFATGSAAGSLSIFDSPDPDSSSFSSTSKFQVSQASIVKVVWVPPEYGDAVAVISGDGALSLWDEIVDDTKSTKWRLCKDFGKSSNQALDVAFGVSLTSLKLVVAYSEGHVKIYELLDPFELKNWQLQAEFQNVADSVSKIAKAGCLSASISWAPQIGESQQLSFALGFNSNISQLNSTKVWEYDEDHQRWLPVAELALPGDQNDPVYAVAWAPNIGRTYQVIATATQKGIAIWHLGLNPGRDGRLSVEKVASLSGHDSEVVWEMEWDMSGMTLATTGSEGVVRLWQSNLNGVWHQQAMIQPTT